MPSRIQLALLFALTLALPACGGDTPTAQASIDRDTFIATYVDLRKAALGRHARELTLEERQAVLAQHGVSEDALLAFVDVHGADIGYMQDVWEEVEARLDAARSTLDSIG